jgi:DNA ligase (NAD+)
MYSKENSIQLQQQTEAFLKIANSAINLQQIEVLRDVLRFHEYKYYVQNNPILSDTEYDILYKALEKVEQQNPALITPNSPTQRVGQGLIKDFAKVAHLVPMLSLENTYNAEDLLDWDRKVRENGGLENVQYCVEPKFDGASISLLYENDNLQRAATRGDGTIGDEITANAFQIKSIPLKAAFNSLGINQVEIRGEVMLTKANFDKYNTQVITEGGKILANARNAAAGALRIKDTAEVAKRGLDAFLYHISYTQLNEGVATSPFITHSEILHTLNNLGFKTPNNAIKVANNIHEVIAYVNQFEQHRDALPYDVDGMVIKVDNLQVQEQLGNTSHHPRWAVAFKFKAKQATSKLLGVEYQVGRTGAVTPVAKIAPVSVGGVTVSSISVHNEDYITEKDLQIGDTILIERSGDVIPQIVKSFSELRDGSQQKIVYPTNCPVCSSALQRPLEEAVWRCSNYNCAAQIEERIIHFVSKDALDIRSFGDANVRKFFKLGFIHTVPDVFALPYGKIASLEGFGKKSLDNLQAAIEQAKTQALYRIIYGLGIRYVGETTAKTLAQQVNHLLDFKNFTIEQLMQLEDVGTKVANSIYEFFSNQENINLVLRLEALGVNLHNNNKTEVIDGNLTGKTFLFTGTLNNIKRADAEALVEKNGGKILSGVSSKLNYLVVGEDAGSKLEKAKKLTGIVIISEEEFLKMV